jgi:hypothetical protein
VAFDGRTSVAGAAATDGCVVTCRRVREGLGLHPHLSDSRSAYGYAGCAVEPTAYEHSLFARWETRVRRPDTFVALTLHETGWSLVAYELVGHHRAALWSR